MCIGAALQPLIAAARLIPEAEQRAAGVWSSVLRSCWDAAAAASCIGREQHPQLHRNSSGSCAANCSWSRDGAGSRAGESAFLKLL